MNDLVKKAEAEVVQVQPSAVPASPIQAAIQSGASPTELLQFMELQERWEAGEAKKAFTQAMAKFRADCPTILKTEKAHNSTYASIAGTLRQIKGLMSSCGLSHSWRTNQEGQAITVTCVVMHSQGHSEETSLTASPDTSGSKNAIQAIGSTVKYLERYTLEACLGLTSDDEMDDDGQAAGGVERIAEEQAMQIHAKLTDNDIDVDKFIGRTNRIYGCNGLNDLRADLFDEVMKAIDGIIATRNKNANS